jgi:hypothetical protein
LLGRSINGVVRLGAIAATGRSGTSGGSTPALSVHIRRGRGAVESKLRFTASSVLGEVVREENAGDGFHIALMTATLILTSVWLDKRSRGIGANGSSASPIRAWVIGSVQGAMHVAHLDIIISGSSQSLLT